MLTVLLCSDGSAIGRTALAEGLRVLGSPDRIVLTMAVAPVDSAEAFGSGLGRHPGARPEETGHDHDTAVIEARQQLAADAAALGLTGADGAARGLTGADGAARGLPGAELTVVLGSPGPAICALAHELPASVIVLSTRGRGGLRRAVLGSVSDHVIRHAPCPVAVVGPNDHPAPGQEPSGSAP